MDRAPDNSKGGHRPAETPAEEFYRSLVEECHEGVLAFDPDGRITVWNQGMARMTGLPRQRCLGRAVAEVLAEMGGPAVGESIQRLLSRGQEGPFVFPMRSTEKGTPGQYELKCHLSRNAAGKITHGMILLGDVTEREATHDALAESDRKHRLRFMKAADAILIIDRTGRYIDANPAACTLTGYTLEELRGMGIGDLSPPEDVALSKARFRRLLASGVSRRERLIRCKDGSVVHVEDYIISLGDGTYQANVREIGARKAAEVQLNRALQQLRFHIERMPLGYVIFDADFRIIEWNPAAERMFGFSAGEVRGRHAYDCIVPPSARNQVDGVWARLLAGDTSSHSINENVCKNGSIIRCEWFNTPLRDTSSKVCGVASMVQDVTERELAESQTRHAQKLESLGVLTGGIAHDFNNLLMVLMGNLSLLKNIPDLPEKARRHLALIDESASRASKLTHQLLAFARTGRHHPQRSDLNNIIRGAVKFFQAGIGPNVAIDLQLEDHLPRIDVDRSQTEQTILNLCLNAAQAMPRGGTVTLQTRSVTLSARHIARCLPHDQPKPGPRVEFVVSDNGVGMDEATLQRIFDPFFSTKSEGHGLGLPAVLGILKQHGARVLVESQPGRGSSFHLYFPIPAPADRPTNHVGSPTLAAKRSAPLARARKKPVARSAGGRQSPPKGAGTARPGTRRRRPPTHS